MVGGGGGSKERGSHHLFDRKRQHSVVWQQLRWKSRGLWSSTESSLSKEAVRTSSSWQHQTSCCIKTSFWRKHCRNKLTGVHISHCQLKIQFPPEADFSHLTTNIKGDAALTEREVTLKNRSVSQRNLLRPHFYIHTQVSHREFTELVLEQQAGMSNWYCQNQERKLQKGECPTWQSLQPC